VWGMRISSFLHVESGLPALLYAKLTSLKAPGTPKRQNLIGSSEDPSRQSIGNPWFSSLELRSAAGTAFGNVVALFSGSKLFQPGCCAVQVHPINGGL